MSLHIVLLFSLLILPLLNGYGQRIDFIRDDFMDIPGDTAAENIIFNLVNAERLKAGLNRVISDRSLRSAARQHAEEMLRLNYFSHTSPVKGLKDPGDRVYRTGLTDFAVGENIALHSLNGSSAEIAGKFMDQWMNSPGHRANILKPEFNTMGAGIVSFIDSIVIDTVIRGQKQRTIILTVKHYGAQVFAERGLLFTELFLEKRNSLVFFAEIRFNIDRDILIQIGNFSGKFSADRRNGSNSRAYHNPDIERANIGGNNHYLLQKPEGNGNCVRIEIPYDKPVSVIFSALWNASEKTYATLLSSQIDYLNQHILHNDLSRSPVRVTRKKIFYEQSDIWFLSGIANIVSEDEPVHGMIQISENEYYEIPLNGKTFHFTIPVFSKSSKNLLRFGLSDNRETAFKHHLKINGKELNKINPKDTEKKKTLNLVFIR